MKFNRVTICLHGFACAVVLFFSMIACDSTEPKVTDECTVYAFSQGGTNEFDPQVFELMPDMNIRAMQKWSIWGDDPSDYDYTAAFQPYVTEHVYMIGGGTASVIFQDDVATEEVFLDMITRDANNNPVPHDYIQTGAYRGDIFDADYRDYLLDYLKVQIDLAYSNEDADTFGLFIDEVNGGFSGGDTKAWNGNEGFTDDALIAFNNYLLNDPRFTDFTTEDWKEQFDMTDDNCMQRSVDPADLEHNFNYRKYLQAHGFNAPDGGALGPYDAANKLAAIWGATTSNRLYPDEATFLGTQLRKLWKEMVDTLRVYARETYDRPILITSNGVFPFVDFNCLGMYPYNPDEEDLVNWDGADYVPVVDGHLDGSRSLKDVFLTMYQNNRSTAGNVPLVTFIDWPTDMMSHYYDLPLEEKKDYWRIFGAETYACGLYPAFHLKTSMEDDPTAATMGMMDFFKEYTQFYREYSHFYHGTIHTGNLVTVDSDTIAYNLMRQKSGSYLLHLVNHAYNQGIEIQEDVQVELALEKKPGKVYMVSPDFIEKKELAYVYEGGTLTLTIDQLTYYAVIVCE
jgi:hypothetical protein